MPHTNSKNGFRNPKTNKHSSKATSFSSRSRRPQVALYDENDRYDYLTGFSARKKASKVAAQERAAERARAEKLEFRRQLKEARMSKIKETIEQQAEWYGVGAFADIENHDQDNAVKAPKRVEHTILAQDQDDNNMDQMNATTTTVTIEPLEIDHTVLMTNSTNQSSIKRVDPSSSSRSHQHHHHHHPTTSTTTTTPSFKPRSGPNTLDKKKKSIKKKKIPYESKATRSIERAKKKSKRDAKSKKR